MIVVGNSNVACLDGVGARLVVQETPADVSWVGALRFRHFYDGHPAGPRVRERFRFGTSGDPRPRLLAIGTHDIFDVGAAVDAGTVEAAIQDLSTRASRFFAEFGAAAVEWGAPVGWIVFPQPSTALAFQRLSPDEVLAMATKVNQHLSELARAHRVMVIDAFDQLGGARVDPGYLQRDAQHLNARGAARLVAAIAGRFNLSAELMVDRAAGAEPEDELGSFCAMLLHAANIAPAPLVDPTLAVETAVEERLREKGLAGSVAVTSDLELVDSGLFDSLDLVDVYTEATRAVGLDIPFDVSLRDLGTPRAFAATIAAHFETPSRADFEVSLAAARRRIPPSAADQAHDRIARLPPERIEAFVEQLRVTLHGVGCPYGAVLMWLGLFARARGDHATAMRHFEAAARVPIPVPIEVASHVASPVGLNGRRTREGRSHVGRRSPLASG